MDERDRLKNLIFEQLNRQAIAKGADFYLDPSSGYQVATSEFLKARGQCCESGCRHCPYRNPTRSKT